MASGKRRRPPDHTSNIGSWPRRNSRECLKHQSAALAFVNLSSFKASDFARPEAVRDCPVTPFSVPSTIMQRLAQNGEFWLRPVVVVLLHLFILATLFVIIPIEELFNKITAGKLLICINVWNNGPHCSNTDHQSMSTMDRL